MNHKIPQVRCKIHGLTTAVYKSGNNFRCKECQLISSKKFRAGLGKKEFKKSNWNHSKMKSKAAQKMNRNFDLHGRYRKPVYSNESGGVGELNSFGNHGVLISWNGWDF